MKGRAWGARTAAAFGLAVVSCAPVRAWGECGDYLITGYVRTEFGPLTADGTPIWTDEAIAAGSYNLPLGSYVRVGGLGTYRIADRGYLGPRHIDIAVWSRAEAFALTGWYWTCVEG